MKRRIALYAVIFLAVGLYLIGADPSGYRLRIGEDVKPIEAISSSGGDLLSLKQIAQALGFSFRQEKGGKYFHMVIGETELTFRTDSQWVTAEDYSTKISQKPRAENNDFFVPADAVTEILGVFYGKKITFEPSTKQITVGAASSEKDAMLDSALRAALLNNQRDDRVFTVVIDPGHGGDELGAIGPNGTLEKDLTLQIAKKLKTALQGRPSTKIVLTRDKDVYLPLEKRAEIANNQGGDLFISIHTNASTSKSAKGAETYFMSLEATDEEAELLAERENLKVRNEFSFSKENSDLQLILWDMAQSAYMNESARLAEMIQKELNRQINLENRGIKQAPFVVLMGVAMPAVLVEVAFITNSREETALKTGNFQEKVVNAITESVTQFIARDHPG